MRVALHLLAGLVSVGVPKSRVRVDKSELAQDSLVVESVLDQFLPNFAIFAQTGEKNNTFF